MASKRLIHIADHLHGVVSSLKNTLTNKGTSTSAMSESDKGVDHSKVDWTTAKIPSFDALPAFKNLPGCAWGVWGPDDQLGTVNLLTDEVVKRAAAEEVKLGTGVSLNWPLNFPEKPVFKRKAPEVNQIVRLAVGIRDDEIHINSQSGTQWDGLRHFPILEHGVYYNKLRPCSQSAVILTRTSTPIDALPSGIHPFPNPHEIHPEHGKIGIQNWATHGICGRGVLLDLVSYQTSLSADKKTLPYDPWSTHAITVEHLEACAAAQGVKFRRGDILLLRVGFIKRYYEASQAEREELGTKEEAFAGIQQSEGMKRFLWDNHFAAIASDQPALECWPPPAGPSHLHQTLLGLWGMPIGEFFDLEKLAQVAAETGRYTFFFSSWPLNIIGGCASPPNAAALF
ncbi:Serine/threonine protein kinase PRP4 [Mycena indigotica]|uniref:Serine/threonine protein kinase PRP4 n=1 Tax=Mycena indigotica TaxID=2126181 RepID=A0A8H6TAK5_9AGAR|nr:Serine/threonine protein kinase PRP4 [Mycena indigotica]KAF7314968.1 Serine/threonine protein kinase PRP4 [Mycena indigotica]